MSLKHKVIITDTSVNSHQVRMCATVSERRMLEVRCRKLGRSILGNIYVRTGTESRSEYSGCFY